MQMTESKIESFALELRSDHSFFCMIAVLSIESYFKIAEKLFAFPEKNPTFSGKIVRRNFYEAL